MGEPETIMRFLLLLRIQLIAQRAPAGDREIEREREQARKHPQPRSSVYYYVLAAVVVAIRVGRSLAFFLLSPCFSLNTNLIRPEFYIFF